MKRSLDQFGFQSSKRTAQNESIAAPIAEPITREAEPQTPEKSCDMDIANFVGKKLDDATKMNVLKNLYKPNKSLELPFSIRMSKGKETKRFLRHEHLETYKNLAYSPSQRGVYCKECVLFAKVESGGRSKQDLKTLVATPLKEFGHMFGKNGYITEHLDCAYHKNAVADAANFIERYENPQFDIRNQLDAKRSKDIEENRNKQVLSNLVNIKPYPEFDNERNELLINSKYTFRLKPIVKTIIFLGKNGLAFRGRNDYGALNNESSCGEGNFRALLKFRADAGDKAIDLSDTKKNAMYFSPLIQNSLIDCCGDLIVSNILEDVKKAKFYTILADETTDSATVEQMSLCIRYTDDKIREIFIGFIEVENMTGRGLATTIISKLKEIGLSIDNLVGQGYDGAASMSGHINGTQNIIRQQQPAAIYIHCASHCLNLCITKSSQVKQIRQCFALLSDTINFINGSSGRRKVLEQLCGEKRKKHLKPLCETRWVERHEAVTTFCLLFEDVLDCLSTISTFNDHSASTKASILLKSLQDSEFLVSLATLEKVLSLTIGLSRQLQSRELDLMVSKSMVKTVIDELESWINGPAFDAAFKRAESLAHMAGEALRLPRITAKQRQQHGETDLDLKIFFKKTIFNVFLQNVVDSLKYRFNEEQVMVSGLFALLPHNCTEYDFTTVANASKVYDQFIDNTMLEAEFQLWQRKWKSTDEKPKSAFDAFLTCNHDYFPNIKTLLQILCTLPVTTASAERSFSTLRYLKTYLRSTMKSKRLNGLAHMYINQHVSLEVNDVINLFAQKNRRRLDFLL